jgi:SAM-dependent methyltransferase
MARSNRNMELAAIAELESVEDHGCVLSIGFGPGVGIADLAHRRPGVVVAGIDPSRTMIRVASRRNRAAVAARRVILEQAGAEAIPWPRDSFDGVVAVNSIQLWSPLPQAVREVARVIRPGGTFVAMTHAWALEKRSSLQDWAETLSGLLTEHGFGAPTCATPVFRTGRALVQRASYPGTDEVIP